MLSNASLAIVWIIESLYYIGGNTTKVQLSVICLTLFVQYIQMPAGQQTGKQCSTLKRGKTDPTTILPWKHQARHSMAAIGIFHFVTSSTITFSTFHCTCDITQLSRLFSGMLETTLCIWQYTLRQPITNANKAAIHSIHLNSPLSPLRNHDIL